MYVCVRVCVGKTDEKMVCLQYSRRNSVELPHIQPETRPERQTAEASAHGNYETC